ncbi:MAG: site-specific DNA-methyltransferase [bacterium]|nr:site-specific DNA-methyltransferase [bacterium]
MMQTELWPVEIREDPPLPPLRRETVVVPGDVWGVGDHRIMCGDATDADQVLTLTRDRRLICVTSPPYGDQRDYGGGNLDPSHLAQFIGAVWPRCDVFAINLGIVRRGREIVCYWDHYIEAARQHGGRLLSWNVWDRSGGGYTVGQLNGMFPIDHEFIIVLGEPRELNLTIPNATAGQRQSPATVREQDGRTKSRRAHVTRPHRPLGSVIHTARVKGNPSDGHPAPFPPEIPEAYIAAIIQDGESVYDPFLGSGTTMIAAHNLGQACMGMEIVPAYCDMAIRRVQRATGATATRESDGMEFPDGDV